MENRITIDRYTGYRHNRHDGYNCSRGILAGLGATGTADCFADASDNDLDEKYWSGEKPLDADFWELVLNNLDITREKLTEIENGEPCQVVEYMGDSEVIIDFSGNPDRVVNVNDGEYIANY